eukprot:gene4445-7820_t
MKKNTSTSVITRSQRRRQEAVTETKPTKKTSVFSSIQKPNLRAKTAQSTERRVLKNISNNQQTFKKPSSTKREFGRTFVFGDGPNVSKIDKRDDISLLSEDIMEVEEVKPILQQQELRYINIDTYENYSFESIYSEVVYDLLREKEKCYRPRIGYIENVQKDINSSMRTILVDWLNDVCVEYKLESQTLYLAVNLVDRVLSEVNVSRGKLQLVGVTSLYLSAKYFELVTPNVEDYVYITDNSYSKEQIVDLELLILNTVKWNLTPVLNTDFLDRYLTATKANSIVRNLSNYLSEITLQNFDFIQFLPSMIAASCVVLAHHSLDLPHWNGTLEHYTGYQSEDLIPCLKKLHLWFIQMHTSLQLTSIKDKYSSSKYQQVALIKPRSFEPPM